MACSQCTVATSGTFSPVHLLWPRDPRVVLPTGAPLCHPHTEALLPGTGPRLGEVRRGCESQACKVSRACSHAPWLRSDSPSARAS